jgi:hypothetical protein
MFIILKHLIKRKLDNIKFFDGPISKADSNEYKVTHVMEVSNSPTGVG